MPFLNILFWAFLVSYVVHILEETLVNGGFVRWIANNFWPLYNDRIFFWFNASALALLATSNILFDTFGGHWVIIPIAWVAGFVTHALTVYFYWTIRQNIYSPGLLTSLLYIVVYYLLIRYGLSRHLVTDTEFIVGTGRGVFTIGTFLTIGPTILFPRIMKKR